MSEVDPVLVGVISNRMFSLLEEQQTALVTTAFSPVVRESMDLACAAFDSRGEMVAQSTGGTPGHINAMATGMHHIVARFPAGELAEGDVLITNDPWMTAGQINDLTVATPIFHHGNLVAWFASCCHSPDIGGRILSASASEVFEEGLRLPILKLRTAAGPNEVLEQIIRANVRTPSETMGDIYAQVAANEVGGRGLGALMEEFALESIDPVANQIMDRSEAALRQRLTELPDGTWQSRMTSDGFGGESLELVAAVTIQGDQITIDYSGSSDQSAYGINVVLNYTRAYTSFAIKAALAPEVPHNAGSFRPVTVDAPLGSVLNCVDPAPVASRHLVGHFLPSLLFDALRGPLQGQLPAASADALWMTVWRGDSHQNDAAPFTLTVFGAGGSGGRPGKDGLTTTGFPTGVRAAPTEVLETLTPLVQTRRELRPDSAGSGEHRGGLGQIVEVRRRGEGKWSVNANIDRVDNPAPGTGGGRTGAAGWFTEVGSDEQLPSKQLLRLSPDSHVSLGFPGGGGWGEPHRRPVEDVLADVVAGYVTPEAARDEYGVVVRWTGSSNAIVRPPRLWALDVAATARLRRAC